MANEPHIRVRVPEFRIDIGASPDGNQLGSSYDGYDLVINVSDTPCTAFDTTAKTRSLWFPINEVGQWTHAPFFAVKRCLDEFITGRGQRVYVHCHAGANRSRMVVYAWLLSLGYDHAQAASYFDGDDHVTRSFSHQVESGRIPADLIAVLRLAHEHKGYSVMSILQMAKSKYTYAKKPRRRAGK